MVPSWQPDPAMYTAGVSGGRILCWFKAPEHVPTSSSLARRVDPDPTDLLFLQSHRRSSLPVCLRSVYE